jgi:hypothetical protein
MTYTIAEFLNFYQKVVIEGDLNKLVAIAKESEAADKKIDLSSYMATRTQSMSPSPPSTHAPTTVSPTASALLQTTVPITSPSGLSWLANFDTKTARCTVPIAMTLFSVVEMIGSLLASGGYNRDFKESAKLFFSHKGNDLTAEEADLLNAIFRNGIMHNFFPKGSDIGIGYDSSYDSKNEIIIPVGGQFILNVNYLEKVVRDTFNDLVDNTAHHANMERLLPLWNADPNGRIATAIANYRASKGL